MDFLSLTGKICLVTGAGQGIGFAIAKELVAQGATVVIADINEETLNKACEELNATGKHAYPYVSDVSDIAADEAMIDWIVKEFGRIDVLVNNAGIAMNVSIADITPEQWDKLMNINLKGTAFISKYAIAYMKKQNYGRIVNMGSIAGERGGRYAGINYSASKAGIIVLTKCFALEGAEYGITCNAIAPGLIETPMSKALGHNPEDVPMKKLGTPENIADTVAFLASDRASYISGMTVDINGGMFMR